MKKSLLLSAFICIAELTCYAQHAFNLGGDISMLPQFESANIPYYSSTTSTTNQDVINFLKGNKCKFNSMRVRLFVNPDNSTDPSLVQNLDYVTALGKRIKNAKLDFMLDIHYSDTWADPSHQSIPATWTTHTNAALADSMYSYTKNVLEHLKDNDATPDFVQIGNEISYGMLWREGVEGDKLYKSNSNWGRCCMFLKAGAQAVREVTPDAKIILHIERAGNKDACVNFFTNMNNNEVDYDIIGLSYYPFWHKDLTTLGNTLNTLETKFPNKPVQIVETAYHYTSTDEYTSAPEGDCPWPATQEGQKQYVEDLCTELAQHNNVTGLYWWYPEENGGNTAWLNRGLWNNQTHAALPALFSMKNFLTLKEEATGIKATSTDKASSVQASLYTLQGQQVTSMNTPGFYVKDGKKLFKR